MTDPRATLIRQAEAKQFNEGLELCHEYLSNDAIWFGSSLVNTGESGAVDPGHPVSWEIFYCVSGEGYMDEGADGSAEYFLRAGDTLTFPPGVPHRIHNRGNEPVLMVWAGGPGE